MSIKLDRKSEIVAIASKLFREKGYSAVTVRDIAQSLDIKAASLYNHISSKQEILHLMIINIAEEYTRNISQILDSSEPTLNKLQKVIKLHIDITVDNPDAMASLNNDWMHLQEDDLKYFLKMREEYEQKFRIIIKNGIEQGELKNHNAEVMIFSMLSTLRTLYLWYGRKNGFTKKTLQDHLAPILLNGII